MGTWGTAISSNDTYGDIYSEFMDLYDDGLSPTEVTKKLFDENSDILNDPDDNHNFWFAIAMAQWQCGELENCVFEKVKSIVEDGSDVRLWEIQGASKKDLVQRQRKLEEFLNKLSSEQKKPRKRKKKIFRDSIYKKGDCLTFKLSNDNYGGALVLEDENQTEYGLNLIAVTSINQKGKPEINDFKNAFVLIQREDTFSKDKDREMISWVYAQFYKRKTVDFEVVGQISVEKTYDVQNDYRSVMQWDMIKTIVDRNDEFIKLRGKPDKVLKLKRL